MKVKSSAPKEDPETKARRLVDEARAEADKTSAMQGILDARQRRIMRVFGTPGSAGNSGASGVPAARASLRQGFTDLSTFAGTDQFGRFDPNIQIFQY